MSSIPKSYQLPNYPNFFAAQETQRQQHLLLSTHQYHQHPAAQLTLGKATKTKQRLPTQISWRWQSINLGLGLAMICADRKPGRLGDLGYSVSSPPHRWLYFRNSYQAAKSSDFVWHFSSAKFWIDGWNICWNRIQNCLFSVAYFSVSKLAVKLSWVWYLFYSDSL